MKKKKNTIRTIYTLTSRRNGPVLCIVSSFLRSALLILASARLRSSLFVFFLFFFSFAFVVNFVSDKSISTREREEVEVFSLFYISLYRLKKKMMNNQNENWFSSFFSFRRLLLRCGNRTVVRVAQLVR